ncbi:type II secretion system F family protein [Ferrimonas aestuarii]|uniref:Type II secretion system protein F n=1 Tax=Ferrimonas aestuarii TaxID=2569539 RepID=A0A4U1BXM3_9GAMM|nr:type II secretion system F family protein [Ferrimonas aestuarii]TKB58475.1 type II secretion system protein F [Ferrimonas aestuarii]
MSLYLALIFGGIALILHHKQKPDPKKAYLAVKETEKESAPLAVNLKALSDNRWIVKLRNLADPVLDLLGDGAWYKISAFVALVFFAAAYVNQRWLMLSPIVFPTVVAVGGFIWGWSFLLKRRKNKFEQTFPDALNIMMSAITAGDSITQAIIYVGETLNNTIGREFKYMGQRLKLGEPPETVFARSTKRFPYPSYLFFVVTIRANMSRGGQLKQVMARLIRVLVDSRAMEKKKMALTSEARLSAKLVAIMPFAFMGIMQLVSPENLQFVLFHPEGRWILFYVLGSEVLGLTIIWLLVRGVRA